MRMEASSFPRARALALSVCGWRVAWWRAWDVMGTRWLEARGGGGGGGGGGKGRGRLYLLSLGDSVDIAGDEGGGGGGGGALFANRNTQACAN